MVRHSGECRVQGRHNGADDHAADFFRLQFGQREKVTGEDAVFIYGSIARGGETPIGDQSFFAEDAQHRIRVTDIERQQHQGASDTSPESTGSVPRPSSRVTRRTPLGSRPAVTPVNVSVALVMRTCLPSK